MQTKSRVRKQYSPAEQQRLLAVFRKSNLTRSEFAAQIGVSLSCLRNWIARHRGAAPPAPAPVSFLELPATAAARAASGLPAYRVQFPGGISLEVSRGFGSEELSQLCQILRRL